MSKYTTLKTINSLFEVDADKATACTYFPFFEPTEEVFKFCNKYGNFTRLYKGTMSGIFYKTYGTANTSRLYSRNLEQCGERERDIIAGLEKVEKVQDIHETGREVLRFIDYKGNAFSVTSTDNGHTWEICG